MRIVRTRRGARIIDGRDVLSEVLDHPGATHTFFDVLAACIAALAPGARIAILGFAGGGLVAPLRAMGCGRRLECVDLSTQGTRLFRSLSRRWAGDVHVAQADAITWLARQRRPFDVILEDISLPGTRARLGVKPLSSHDVLPQLMQRKLSPQGIAITNLLPLPRQSWDTLLQHQARPFPRAYVVCLADYVNRILVTGNCAGTKAQNDAGVCAGSARHVSLELRRALRRIGSVQADRLRVQQLALPPRSR